MTYTETAGQPAITVLSRDVFFGMRIRTALKHLGYAMALVKSEPELEAALAASPALAFVDFNAPVDWDAISATIADHPDVPIVAFGAHTDVAGFQKAKAAGVARVVANRSFSQQLPALVERYARS